MSDKILLVILETKNLPRGYKALQDMTTLGLEPLEFYPHAKGVRLLFKAPSDFLQKLPAEARALLVSNQILKAILSQSGLRLKKYLVVVETQSFFELVALAQKFEEVSAEILELRALRSNPEINYGLFSVENKDLIRDVVGSFEHSVLEASSKALQDFLGFT